MSKVTNRPFFVSVKGYPFRKGDVIVTNQYMPGYVVLKVYRMRWWKKALSAIVYFLYSETIKWRTESYKVKSID